MQCSIKIELINDSWTELRGEIAGPPDTPYEGGKFSLEIKVPETYPFNPPKVCDEILYRAGTDRDYFIYLFVIDISGALHHTNLASKHFVSHRCNMSGYSERQLVCHAHFASSCANETNDPFSSFRSGPLL